MLDKLVDTFVCSVCGAVFYIEIDKEEIFFCPCCGNETIDYDY